MSVEKFTLELDKFISSGFKYSERAKRDMECAHIDEVVLVKLLREIKKIESKDDMFILYVKRASKIFIKISGDKLCIESIAYNPPSVVF